MIEYYQATISKHFLISHFCYISKTLLSKINWSKHDCRLFPLFFPILFCFFFILLYFLSRSLYFSLVPLGSSNFKRRLLLSRRRYAHITPSHFVSFFYLAHFLPFSTWFISVLKWNKTVLHQFFKLIKPLNIIPYIPVTTTYFIDHIKIFEVWKWIDWCGFLLSFVIFLSIWNENGNSDQNMYVWIGIGFTRCVSSYHFRNFH